MGDGCLNVQMTVSNRCLWLPEGNKNKPTWTAASGEKLDMSHIFLPIWHVGINGIRAKSNGTDFPWRRLGSVCLCEREREGEVTQLGHRQEQHLSHSSSGLKQSSSNWLFSFA